MNLALKACLVALALTTVESLNIPGAKQVSRIPGVKQITKIGGNIPIVGRAVFGKQRTRKITKEQFQQAEQAVQSLNNPYQAYGQQFPPQQFPPQQFAQQQFIAPPQYS